MTFNIKGHDRRFNATITPVDDNQYRLEVTNDLPYRTGFKDSPEDMIFVDPAGGPFIGVGSKLKDHHRDLPDKEILRITGDRPYLILHTA